MTANDTGATRSRPLRVLFVVPDLERGGAERHVTTLLPALDRSEFEPSLVCIGDEGKLFSDLTAGGVRARALLRRKWQYPGALIELVAEMRRTRPDVVVTRGFSAETLGRVAAVLVGVPHTVVWVHNSFGLGTRGHRRRLIDRLLDRRTSAYYGVAHAQVPYLVGELGYPVDKVTIIHNGVDLARFPVDAATTRDAGLAATLGIGADDPVVGALAVLRPEKDHATLLRAARIVIDEIPLTRVLLVGDGPVRPELESLADRLGMTDHVVFAGASNDVAPLLRLMDVVTLTSTSECFPMAVLEAMASGRPVISTCVGGVPEVVDEGTTGHLVPVGDPVALAARLIPLLRDRRRSRAMGEAARARVEADFNLETSIHGAERALQRTANRAPTHGTVYGSLGS